MFKLLGWAIYGLFVGTLIRWFYPGKEPDGCLITIGLGVAGSFVGGGINWVLNGGGPYSASGVVMGVLGGLVCCFAYNYYLNKNAK